jgi:LmbE family N-acetylglucosaminyl deacetylase
MRRAAVPLVDWLAGVAASEIHVVSPHLDDAALSVHALLRSRLGPACRVTTVFTAAPTDGGSGWAQATGFRDAVEEFTARRNEDHRAMARLGVRFDHLGLQPADWGDAASAALAQRLVPESATPGAGAQPFIWLPAGAGQPLGMLSRWRRRLLRQPMGADAHEEHRFVRDRLWHALRAAGAHRIGFYAENPYLWTDQPARLAGELEARFGEPLTAFTLKPDVADKLQVVSEYTSQLALIVGTKPSYQRRVLGLPEVYFVPAALVHPNPTDPAGRVPVERAPAPPA